ncbi:MAG: cobalamin biosynthesis protein CbiX [Gammaproteobacteria bacterium]|nr:cobalamin biosynthesis protein CbiX [Gammaproteobacteria bacterium]
MPITLLVDNGSKQAQATLALRQLASALSAHRGETVHPVSLQHADHIPAEQLQHQPAQVFQSFLLHQLQQGEHHFIVLPLFFGESRALTSFIPEQVEKLQSEYPQLRVEVAAVTYPLPEGDERMAQIIAEHVAQSQTSADEKVVLVDHGSPIPQITAVRDGIAQAAQRIIGRPLDQACMERRQGSEYDFNGQLLADWLSQHAEQGISEVIIAMLFFLPGRHAGACGDIEEICAAVKQQYPQLNYTISPLISEHPLLVEILNSRLQSLLHHHQ